MKSCVICLVICLGATLFGLACSPLAFHASNSISEEFHQTIPLNADGRLTLDNVNGEIRIVTWDENSVRVDAVKRARSQDHLDAVKIEINASPCLAHETDVTSMCRSVCFLWHGK